MYILTVWNPFFDNCRKPLIWLALFLSAINQSRVVRPHYILNDWRNVADDIEIKNAVPVFATN